LFLLAACRVVRFPLFSFAASPNSAPADALQSPIYEYFYSDATQLASEELHIGSHSLIKVVEVMINETLNLIESVLLYGRDGWPGNESLF
jgi:hypothetical protein